MPPRRVNDKLATQVFHSTAPTYMVVAAISSEAAGDAAVFGAEFLAEFTPLPLPELEGKLQYTDSAKTFAQFYYKRVTVPGNVAISNANPTQRRKIVFGLTVFKPTQKLQTMIGTYESRNGGCPQSFGRHEAHSAQETNHGDVCRNHAKDWDCPRGCSVTEGRKAPWCTLAGTSAPCRNRSGKGPRTYVGAKGPRTVPPTTAWATRLQLDFGKNVRVSRVKMASDLDGTVPTVASSVSIRSHAPVELSGSGDNSATGLLACTGECDADSQCASGLTCFQRSNGEAIPGCSGSGSGKDWDYCHDPHAAADPVWSQDFSGATRTYDFKTIGYHLRCRKLHVVNAVNDFPEC